MYAMQWPVDYYPFWREESPYPFAHFVLPLALYGAVRNVLLTMLLVYVWESVEQLLARTGYARYAGEQWDDSWFGDIVLGLLAAGTFAVADSTYGWREAVQMMGPPLWLRVVGYLAIVLASVMVRWQCGGTWVRWQLLLFTAVYAAVTLAVFAPYWNAGAGAGPLIRASTLAWLAVALVAMLISLPVLPAKYQLAPVYAAPPPSDEDMDVGFQGARGVSSYVRVLVLALLLLATILTVHVVRTLDALGPS